jgi:MFS family permease
MDLSPLRHRDYRLLFASQSISLLGTMMTYVALPYQMYEITRSSFSVGLLGLAELAALLTTAFFGGVLADAVDRRKMAIATDIALSLGSLSLTMLAARGVSGPGPLFVAAAFMSGMAALQRPSIESLVPRLVAADEMPAVAGLAGVRGSVGMIAGPAIGGVLIGSVGLRYAYLIDFITYLLSLLCLWSIRFAPLREKSEPIRLAAVVDGLRYARSRQELIGTYVVDFVAMVFGMPLALFPAMADRLGGPTVLGSLYAAPAIGALAASLTSRWTPRVRRHGLAVLLAATAWGLAIVAFGMASSVWPALICLGLAGGADAVSGIFRMTMWNETIPDAFRGRLASIEMVSYSSGPLLGHFEAGAVAALYGVRASVVSGGVLCVIGVVVCAAFLPQFVAYRSRVERPG